MKTHVACTVEGRSTIVADAEQRVAAPEDLGERCLDVGAEGRACWDVHSDDFACVGPRWRVPRPVMRTIPPTSQRCWGQRDAHYCAARADQAGLFRCDGASCVQAHPRMPDAGEWLCVEMQGVVLCKGTGDAAGMAAGERDRAFVCGQRRGHPEEEICVDLSPDPPPQEGRSACHFRYASGFAERACTASAKPQVGAPCGEPMACPAGSQCVGQLCLPPYPKPNCWLDGDCPTSERCRWGSCVPNHG